MTEKGIKHFLAQSFSPGIWQHICVTSMASLYVCTQPGSKGVEGHRGWHGELARCEGG